jgi:site-specific DNA-cytosine methylase
VLPADAVIYSKTLIEELKRNLKMSEGKKRKINVLSLFDGMSCGQIALNKVGIEYENYFASEIDKYAIQVTQKNYPNTKQLGSVTELDGNNLPKIDLMYGGSPCQSFSNAGNGTGFDGKSGLFYEYVRLLKECNPKYFLLENVKMKKQWQDIISKELGCEPIQINSNYVSAQNRKRLYWTNIPVLELQYKSIFIEDILDSEFDNKYWLKERNTELLLKKVDITNAPNIACIDVYNKKVKLDRKCPTLTLPHHNSIRLLQNGKIRKLTPNECEKLQNVPLNYTDCDLSDIHRYSMLGNGWTVDVIAHIFSFLKGGEIFNNFSTENV